MGGSGERIYIACETGVLETQTRQHYEKRAYGRTVGRSERSLETSLQDSPEETSEIQFNITERSKKRGIVKRGRQYYIYNISTFIKK